MSWDVIHVLLLSIWFLAKKKLASGELKPEDIPVSSKFSKIINKRSLKLLIVSKYMQRGGAWDNSDVKGAKRGKWNKSDKDYASGGYRKSQSVSIFGEGPGLDWTGSRGKSGPAGQNPGQDDKPKKKLFGLF